MKSQFARFVLTSAVAAALNFVSRIIFSQWVHFIAAVILAFVVGLVTAFLLNRALVFSKSGKHWSREASWFLTINLLGLALTVTVSWILSRYLLPALGQISFVEETAHAAGIAAPIVTSYIGHKHITFRRTRP